MSVKKCCALINLKSVGVNPFSCPNPRVDGIAKDGAKSQLYYSSVALGCDFYPQIKFSPFVRMSRQMELRRDGHVCLCNLFSCAATPLVPWF
jgi:hypothetical protein